VLLGPGTLIMRPALFHGYGSARAKGLLPLTRNITVRSADPAMTASIDWAMLDGTMLLKAGRSLTFKDLGLTNIRCGGRPVTPHFQRIKGKAAYACACARRRAHRRVRAAIGAIATARGHAVPHMP
jgi:hypothetical protein